MSLENNKKITKDLKRMGSKFLRMMIKILVSPFYSTYGIIFDGDTDIVCGSPLDIKHDWAYWDGHYTSKDPNITSFKRARDFRQCTHCKTKQTWAQWGGLGGDGGWEVTNHNLPLDKEYVSIEVFSDNHSSTETDMINSEKKSRITSSIREARLDKLLKNSK